MKIAICSDSVLSNKTISQLKKEIEKEYTVVKCKIYNGSEVSKLIKELSKEGQKVDAIVWLAYPDACTYLDVAIGFWDKPVEIGGVHYDNYLTKTLKYRPAVIHINVSPIYKNWDPPHDKVCIRAWDSYGAGPYNFAGFNTSGAEFLTLAGIPELDAPSATEEDPEPHPKELAQIIKLLLPNAVKMSNKIKEIEFPTDKIAMLKVTPAPPNSKIHPMFVVESGTRLANWIDNNHSLPKYVRTTVGAVSPERWSYIAAYVIATEDIIKEVKIPTVNTNESSGNTYTGGVTFNTLKDMAKRYVEFVNKYGMVPRYVRITTDSDKTVGWKEFTYMLARTLRWYHKNASWPSYVYIKPVESPWDTSISTYAQTCCTWKEGCGECDEKLEEITSSLTEPDSVHDTVKNLAQYVAYRIDYAYYYNSQLGACGVIERGYGNCCDQSNLLVALLRRAEGYWGKGIPVQYEHIYGRWRSGYYGHVRTRVYLPDEGWVMIDPSMICGRFLGECDYTTVEIWGRYRCLPFTLKPKINVIQEPKTNNMNKNEHEDFASTKKEGVIIGMGGAPKTGGMA